MKNILFITAYLLVTSCANAQPKSSSADMSRENRSIGWMHGNCLAIKNPDIETPKEVTIVELKEPQIVDVGVITQKALSSDNCYPLLDDRKNINMDSGYSFYLVDTKNPVNMAIGMLETRNLSNLHFSLCTTTEGVLFTIKDAKDVLWTGYYFLGYESEATCK